VLVPSRASHPQCAMQAHCLGEDPRQHHGYLQYVPSVHHCTFLPLLHRCCYTEPLHFHSMASPGRAYRGSMEEQVSARNIRCCCGQPDCEVLSMNENALAILEGNVTSAASLGQVCMRYSLCFSIMARRRVINAVLSPGIVG
jgi:hypothetical protein